MRYFLLIAAVIAAGCNPVVSDRPLSATRVHTEWRSGAAYCMNTSKYTSVCFPPRLYQVEIRDSLIERLHHDHRIDTVMAETEQESGR